MENSPATSYLGINGALVESPCDMPDDILRDVVELAKQAATKFDVDKDGALAAEYIKTRLDETHAPHWHVIIGNGFGCYAVHESRRFVYFQLNKRAYLVYKT